MSEPRHPLSYDTTRRAGRPLVRVMCYVSAVLLVAASLPFFGLAVMTAVSRDPLQSVYHETPSVIRLFPAALYSVPGWALLLAARLCLVAARDEK